MAPIRTCSNPTCGNTESKAGEFKKCARCKSACYCSKKCQMEHWKNGHREECKPVEPEQGKTVSAAEKRTETNNEQVIMLRKECQDMYNNYEMASNDLEAVNQKLHRAEITLNKLDEIEPSRNVYCGYGSMFMLQSHDSVKECIDGRKSRFSTKAESLTKQVKYFEKRYKDLEANLKDM